MARQDVIFTSFNRGEVSTLLLGRTDLEHLRLAAEVQVNWQPRVLGPMTIRPGSRLISGMSNGATPSSLLRFVASANDRAIIELQPNIMRVWVVSVDGSAITLVTRAAVSATIPNFGAGWVVGLQTGTALITLGGGVLAFSNINVGANAQVYAPVNIPAQDVGIEHAIRFQVLDGPIAFSIGASTTSDEIFGTETLDTGIYSLAFTPTHTGLIYVQFNSVISPETSNTISMSQSQGIYQVTVVGISMEAAGAMVLPTPWPASVLTDQPNGRPSQVRYDASADVTFVACAGIPQQQINRYSPTSWSVVLYKPVKGPMSAVKGSSAVLLSVGSQYGDTIMTANQAQFTPADVGTLFRLFHNGQTTTNALSFNGTVSDVIRVTGVSEISTVSGGTIINEVVFDRTFAIDIAGNWTGNLILQRSFSGYTTDFNLYQTYTNNQHDNITDWLNNEIVYYRFLFQGTGTPIVAFAYPFGGGAAGVCRVTSYVNPLEVTIEVLVPFSNAGVAFDWRQSEWSASQGFPTSVALHEGRLWWAGSDRWWGSISDDYNNFDFDAIGDAAPISVQIGEGPIANVNWLLSIDGLLGGGDTQIIAARSDAIQTPLTPTNFNTRFTSQGSAQIQAVKIDNRGIMINQSTRRIYEARYDNGTYNYLFHELSNLNPDIGAPGSRVNAATGGYIGMALQRNPDTNIILVRSDGQLVTLLYDLDDDVKAFWRRVTLGAYDNVVVLPAPTEDMVIVSVIRSGIRYLEQFARLDQCVGDTLTCLSDSYGIYQGPTTNVLHFPWLANQTVAIWIDGTDAALTPNEVGELPGPFVMDSNGTLVLQTTFQNAVVGLPYTAKYLSTKLAYAAQMGTAINQTKRVDHLGLVMQYTHKLGVRYSPFVINPQYNLGSFNADFSEDFDNNQSALWDNTAPIDDLPLVEMAMEVPTDTIWRFYDQRTFEFPDDSNTDSRIYLEAASPRPATVVALTFEIETNN